MQHSKERAARRAYESLGRSFVLDMKFRLLLKEMRKEELKKMEPWMPLWLRWFFRIFSGGVTV